MLVLFYMNKEIKGISVSEFKRKANGIINGMEKGEKIYLTRNGKIIAVIEKTAEKDDKIR